MKFLLCRGLTFGAALNHTVFSHIWHRSLHWQATSPKAITGFQPTSPKAYPPIITGLGLSTTNNHNHKPLLIKHLVSEGGHFWWEFEAVSHNPPCLLLACQFLWLTPSPFLVQTSRTSWSWRYLPSGEGRFESHVRLIPPIHGNSWWMVNPIALKSFLHHKNAKYVSRFPAVVPLFF